MTYLPTFFLTFFLTYLLRILLTFFLAFLAQPAASHLPGLLTPSQLISQKRFQFLGRILRDPLCLEHQMIFGPSHSFLRLSSPFRRGAPRAHWPELAFTEAYHRIQSFSSRTRPPTHDFLNPHFRTATLDLHKL